MQKTLYQYSVATSWKCSWKYIGNNMYRELSRADKNRNDEKKYKKQ